MPIKFRCQHCDQFLGISRAKAGAISDCPNCGRTIRIPNLDGSVEPLPKPQLNLKDDELVKALGALATIDEQSESPSVVEHTPEVVELAPAPAPRAVVVIEPEPVQEAPRPIPVPETRQVGRNRGHHESHASVEENGPLELEILPDVVDSPSRIMHRQKVRFGPGVLLLGCLLSLICGVIIGRATATLGMTPAPTAPEPIGAMAQVAEERSVEPPSTPVGPTVAGTMTYISPTGESRADRGARVLILPLDRKGTAKLSTIGFRVGANIADQEMLTAAVRSLGGDFVLAGDDGRYSLTLPAGGRFGVLMASRYQARESSSTLPGPMTNFINTYFDRPDLLLGQVQVHFETVDVDAEKPIKLDYAFPAI